MRPHLDRDGESLRQAAALLSNRRQLAVLLEVPYDVLVYHAFIDYPGRYREFTIAKRAGGTRIIAEPSPGLKAIQRKLAQVFHAIYVAKPSVHGFVQDNSIVSNARNHTRKANVLNLDLLDFFPSIHFGRVRGLLKAKPYSFPEDVAVVIARLCCNKGVIPQGAPTSPSIANMICARMDTRLQLLAKQFRCTYTRYADDLTFSTTSRIMPGALARRDPLDGTKVILGDELLRAIQENGFSVNRQKVRLQCRDCRQEVTGLTVNRFPNVRRQHVRRVKAMLHAWQKFGLENAERVHHQKFSARERGPGRDLPGFQQIVKGHIDYIGMVRGISDPAYQKLLNWYAEVNPRHVRRPPPSTAGARSTHDLAQCLWVLESDECSVPDVRDHQYLQGTAFLLKDFGLVTCEHVLRNDTYAYPPGHPEQRHDVEILYRDSRRDLAVLRIKGVVPNTPALLIRPTKAYIGQSITLAGFPRYAYGDAPHIAKGLIKRVRNRSGVRRFLLDIPIIAGNSGGPVVDENFRLVGVAVTGADSENAIDSTDEYGVVPVEELVKLRQEHCHPPHC